MRMKCLMQDCSLGGGAHEQMERLVTTAYSLLKARSWIITEYDPVLYVDQDERMRFSRDTNWIWSGSLESLMALLRDPKFGFDMLGIWLLAEDGTLSSRSLLSLPQAYDWSEDVHKNGFDVQGEGCFIAIQGMHYVGVCGPAELLAEIRKSFPEMLPCE